MTGSPVVVGAAPLAVDTSELLEIDGCVRVVGRLVNTEPEIAVHAGAETWTFRLDDAVLVELPDSPVTLGIARYDPIVVVQAVDAGPGKAISRTAEALDGARAVALSVPDLMRIDAVYESDGLDIRMRHSGFLEVTMESDSTFYAQDVAIYGDATADLGLEMFFHSFTCQIRNTRDGSERAVPTVLGSTRVPGHRITRLTTRAVVD